MSAEFPLLESVRVASPCSAAWDGMEGDDRSRFCAECGKHVYNLSELSRPEAEALLREKSGGLCVRFYRRRDGTVLTDNCPVGLRAMRRALVAQTAALAAVFAAVPVFGAVAAWVKWENRGGRLLAPFQRLAARLGLGQPAVMGAAPLPVRAPLPASGASSNSGSVRKTGG